MDIADIEKRLAGTIETASKIDQTALSGNQRRPGESQRDFLIRTGKITPFSKMAARPLARLGSTLMDVLIDAEQGNDEEDEEEELPAEFKAAPEQKSHQNLAVPGFAEDISSPQTSSDALESSGRPAKRRRLHTASNSTRKARKAQLDPEDSNMSEASDDDDFQPDMNDGQLAALGESSDMEGISAEEYSSGMDSGERKRKKGATDDLQGLDDGNENSYQARLKDWVSRRTAARAKVNSRKDQTERELDEANGDDVEEWYRPCPTFPDTEMENGYRMPGDIYPILYDYQKTGVKWLWELHEQKIGGILADQMGLGKTIQMISYLAGLHYSRKWKGPVIVVAPATLMKQWVSEFHRWWQPFRVSILHSSGSGMTDKKSAQGIVDRVLKDGHILVTTYSGLQTYAELLLKVNWGYAILDEGHKIRNPEAAITIYCKDLLTSNRIILSGTPMQNNLIELWSLLDFCCPLRFGSMNEFKRNFEQPITRGGRATASNLELLTADKCAATLLDAARPYILQRYKTDVAADLPKKSEKVIFCKLTRPQREAYENFLGSEDMKSIMSGNRQALFGIDVLRKICNHPDLVHHKQRANNEDYGKANKSGKIQMVKALLDIWTKGGHKTLLFTQTKIMMEILEKQIKLIGGINYRRMDGSTPINVRQSMVDEFNSNPAAHVFLLTTRTGGLGVNLTGADRVILFDPDWNPSTDMQAQERAWRLGQKREVVIFRLLSEGTIEEKIYHRQIFKTFLTAKVMNDPKQRQTFQLKDLHDLFTLGSGDDATNETSRMFPGAEANFDKDGKDDEVKQIESFTATAKVEDFDSSETPSPPENSADATAASEDRLLKSIFSRAGAGLVLQHDQIINGKLRLAADPKTLEAAAAKAAKQAADSLRRAKERAQNTPIGAIAGTGNLGVPDRPVEGERVFSRNGVGLGGRGVRARAGLGSAAVLAGLGRGNATRNGNGISSVPSSRGSTPGIHTNSNTDTGITTPRGREFKPKTAADFVGVITEYLKAQGGRAYTAMLDDHFKRFCPRDKPRLVQNMKVALKEVAVSVRPEGSTPGRGYWELKPGLK
jgi:DNA excision repair protein ERCC-6